MIEPILSFGDGDQGRPEYTLNAGSAANLELFTWVKSATGWDGVSPVKITVNVASGAIWYSNSTAAYALYIRSFPPPEICDLTINVLSGAYIVGMPGAGGYGSHFTMSGRDPVAVNGGPGGQGGPAIYCSSYCKIANYGAIGAGAGGGGGGGARYFGGMIRSDGGGSGGSGAGYAPAAAGGFVASTANPKNGTAGGVGSLTAGGYGGTGYRYDAGPAGVVGGGDGGYGGNLGQPGAAGGNGIRGSTSSTDVLASSGGPGGATNYVVYGNGYITWLATGTRLGWFA